MKVHEGESVTVEIAGAEVTLKAEAVADMFIERASRRSLGDEILVGATLGVIPPAIGADWPSAPGWKYAGVTRAEKEERDAHLLVKVLEGEFDHEDALVACLDAGGRAATRAEGALCYANVPDLFNKERVYWLAPSYAGYESYAWCQYFYYGTQHSYPKDGKLRAFAVRRLPIE